MVLFLVAVSLKELHDRCNRVRSMVWAESTWHSKRSQWKRFLDFCSSYHLQAVPASAETVSLYITYLCDQVVFSMITNYVSSIWSLHSFLGAETDAKGSFLVHCTMKGAKRLLGDLSLSADPLFPEHLIRMYKMLDNHDKPDLIFWTATCLAYRCLLRKATTPVLLTPCYLRTLNLLTMVYVYR